MEEKKTKIEQLAEHVKSAAETMMEAFNGKEAQEAGVKTHVEVKTGTVNEGKGGIVVLTAHIEIPDLSKMDEPDAASDEPETKTGE